jgi:hypothetical protein
MPNDRLELIHGELERTVDHQSTKLDELRGRSATVLQAASIVTAFLGAETYSKDPNVLAGVAAVAFAVVVACTVWVLRPQSGWEFTNDPLILLEDVQAGAYDDVDGLRSVLIEAWAPKIETNEEKLDVLSTAVLVGVIALGAEALLLFGALATR